jgi:hypothetical protein
MSTRVRVVLSSGNRDRFCPSLVSRTSPAAAHRGDGKRFVVRANEKPVGVAARDQRFAEKLRNGQNLNRTFANPREEYALQRRYANFSETSLLRSHIDIVSPNRWRRAVLN